MLEAEVRDQDTRGLCSNHVEKRPRALRVGGDAGRVVRTLRLRDPNAGHSGQGQWMQRGNRSSFTPLRGTAGDRETQK